MANHLNHSHQILHQKKIDNLIDMKCAQQLFLITLCTLAVTSCGNTPPPNTSNPNPVTNPNPNPNAEVITGAQIKICHKVTGSTHPAAGNCLRGKFTGKTTEGKACTLFLGKNGHYYYQSPKLTYGYKNSASALNYFTFDGQLINWGISDNQNEMNAEIKIKDSGYHAKIKVKHAGESSDCIAESKQ